jgi:hypothetical protein
MQMSCCTLHPSMSCSTVYGVLKTCQGPRDYVTKIRLLGCLRQRLLISFGIHEHFTVTDILVFGRETGFPTQICIAEVVFVKVTPRNGNNLD